MNKKLSALKPVSNTDGFTLLEAMIALLILSIGILGMSALQTNSIHNNSRAMSLTRAVNVAVGVLEDLRNRPSSDAELNPSVTPYTRIDPSTGYPVSWTVTQPPGGAKQIVVTVSRPNYPSVKYEYVKN